MSHDTFEPTLLCCCPLPARARPRSAGATIADGELATLREHALRSYPNECCGVLAGTAGQRVEVRAVHPTDNHDAEQTATRYEIDPREILTFDRAAERAGQQIIGFYHSHPDHSPVPSARDVELAWPGYIYLIVSVDEQRRTTVRAWRFEGEGADPLEVPIVSRGSALRKLGRIYRMLVNAWR
ncbi:MAG: M67 family metallopeptidase [Armatimonadota bacterium]